MMLTHASDKVLGLDNLSICQNIFHEALCDRPFYCDGLGHSAYAFARLLRPGEKLSIIYMSKLAISIPLQLF
jgi:hypothetical protein